MLVPNENLERIKISLNAIRNATEQEKDWVIESASYLERALNDSDFWEIIKSKYPLAKEKRSSIYGRSLTFEEFKGLIMSGNDAYSQNNDKDIDVDLSFYYSWKKVVGYTYPSTIKTWFNRKMKAYFDPADLSGNIAHEYLHNCGFDHLNSLYDTITYVFGYAVRDFIRANYLGNIKKPRYKRTLRQRIGSFFRRLF